MSRGFQMGKRLPFVPSLITGDSDEDLSMYDFVKKKRADKEMTKVPAAKSSSHKSESKSDAGRKPVPAPPEGADASDLFDMDELFDEAGETKEVDPPPPPSSVPVDKSKLSKGEKALREEAKTKHHLMTHVPKNPFCPTCQRAKMFKPPSYQTNGSRFIEAEKLGEHLTGDHLVVYRDNEEEIIDSRLALVIKDVATGFLAAYPSGRMSQDE